MLSNDPDEVLAWVQERVPGLFPTTGVSCIGWEQDGELTAGVVFDSYTTASITAYIAIERGSVIAKEFIKAIFEFPFVQLKVKKILAFVESTNDASLKMLDKMGFIEEARITDVYPDAAMVIMTLVEDNCSWLKRLQNGKEVH